MRRGIVAVVLAAAVAGPPVGPARAAESFTFYGSGFGHGLGLSQWGAYGLALQGWSHGEILRHFYTGTRVEPAEEAPARLRIGLVQGRSRIRLEARVGGVELRLGGPGGELVATVPAGETWTVRERQGRYRILDAQGARVGPLVGGTDTHLFAVYAPSGARVRVPEAGHTYARGWIEFNIYACGGTGCLLRLVAVLTPQEYLYGLGEVPSSWPGAALRAQAVAARSYAFAKARSGQNRPGCNCALYASALDQVYVGYDKEAGPGGDRWVAAVDATDGEVVTYQGSVIQAFYSSSSGGHTENNENVWGGSPIAYLRGVCDPGDYTPANPSAVWSVTMSAQEVTDRLRPYTGDIGEVTGFSGIVRGVSGRIVTLTVEGSARPATISGGVLRAALGLRDDRVWINVDKNVVGEIRREYDRLGCRPGLPRTPRRATPGGTYQHFDRGAIYRNEARARTIWLRGPLYAKYVAVGDARGVLGLPRAGVRPITGVEGCGGNRCRRAVFEGGRIYFRRDLGAHALYGPVLQYYLDQGGARGRLGFPTTDVEVRADGSTRASFENGTVTCSPGGRCREA